MLLMGRRTWWLPAWLDRVLPHLDVEGGSHDEPSDEEEKETVDA
jgi:RND superfamily putative drug exporter